MKIASLDKLLEQQLQDLFHATCEYHKILPEMVKATSHDCVRETFQDQIMEAASQLQLLNQIGMLLQVNLAGKRCVAVEALVEETITAIELEATASVVDVALIAIARRIIHHQVALIESAYDNAIHLSQNKVADSLFDCREQLGNSLDDLAFQANDEVLSYGQANSAPNLSIYQPEGDSSGIFVWDFNKQMACARSAQ
jgi:ferritin-like metal-binding protein YciE